MRWSIAPKAGKGLDVNLAMAQIPVRASVCLDIGEMSLITWRYTDPGNEVHGSGMT
jgi:hypothetical protein